MKLEFTKMEGLGNDYIYVDAARFQVSDPSELAVRLSDRHFGIGADGLVLIGRSSGADFSMRMFNADGSEGMMCGNAARCIAKYVYDKGLTHSTEITLETPSGIKRLSLHLAGGEVESVTVDMGKAVIRQGLVAVEAAGRTFEGIIVDVGNPHFVIPCDDADAVDLNLFGPAVERHPMFPGRTNVEFISRIATAARSDAKFRLRMRVWERGSGITLACGTGACAAAAAAVSSGMVSSPCEIVMDGGTLTVSCNEDGTLLLKGPARTVFEGTIDI